MPAQLLLEVDGEIGLGKCLRNQGNDEIVGRSALQFVRLQLIALQYTGTCYIT